MGTLEWNLSFERFRTRVSACGFPFGIFRFGSLVWDLRLGSVALDRWLEHLRIKTSSENLHVDTLRQGTVDWDLYLLSFCLGS